MRILAVIIVAIAAVTCIVDYALTADYYKDQREELNDDWDEHKQTHDVNFGIVKEDCDTCESYEDSEKSLERQSITLVTGTVNGFLFFVLFAAILFIAGEIASKVGGVKKVTAAPAAPVPPMVPPVAPAQVCPTCGTPKKGNENFCNICGRPF